MIFGVKVINMWLCGALRRAPPPRAAPAARHALSSQNPLPTLKYFVYNYLYPYATFQRKIRISTKLQKPEFTDPRASYHLRTRNTVPGDCVVGKRVKGQQHPTGLLARRGRRQTRQQVRRHSGASLPPPPFFRRRFLKWVYIFPEDRARAGGDTSPMTRLIK